MAKGSVEEIERKMIREHAAQWLLELQDDAPDRHEEFCAWVRQSPSHVEEFLLAAAAWRALAHVGPRDARDVEAVIEKAFAQTGIEATNVVSWKTPEARQRAPTRRYWGWAAGLAAAVLAAVSVGSYVTLSVHPILKTAVGEQRNARLDDGSLLYLNANSRVSVHYSRDERQVELLQGEALFVVAKDAARPFRVRAGTTVVQAVGTQFNVNRRSRDTTVVVLEGSVKVAQGKELRLLTAGDEATVGSHGALSLHRSVDPASSVAWRERRLVFRGETLENIADEVNRYGSRRLRVEGEVAKQRRIAGTFSADDPQALVQFIRQYDDLEVQATGDEVVVRQR